MTTFVNALIRRAKRTPYFHLPGYMERYWLFNPYEATGELEHFPDVPMSVRLHHIMRGDNERHLHSHPWVASSIILRGWYVETRLVDGVLVTQRFETGDSNTLTADTFHKIDKVSPGGVWTLFTMGPKVDTWGFLVDGEVVPYRKYLGIPEGQSQQGMQA